MSKKKELEFGLKDLDPNNNIEFSDVNELGDDFQQMINTDPRYSLSIDPTNKYHFNEQERDFIEQMVQYKNVQFVSMIMLNIPVEDGVNMYKSYAVQQEIKRINMAMYARRFCSKMADLDNIGGFLTTALTDENVAVADRLKPAEKLTAAKMLISLNALKREGYNKPEIIDVVEVQKDLDKLSPNDLKTLIEFGDDNNDKREKLIDIINKDKMLSMEEIKNLQTMPMSELEDLADLVSKVDFTDEDKGDLENEKIE